MHALLAALLWAHATALQQAVPLREQAAVLEEQLDGLQREQRATASRMHAARAVAAALEVERLALLPEVEQANAECA